ncbi:MAG: zinc-binding dehydrogenase [Eubacteriales bacterium]|nr:zinc-binding dehydrogenase [Eubacteriales bacterium]
MKAYVFAEKGKIVQRELPAPVLSEARAEDRRAAILKPRYISPCQSDVHTVYAGPGPRRENLVLGHEGVAEIVALGTEVSSFRVGELVAVSAVMPDIPDGTGHEHVPFSGSKLGRNINGMWAERFYVPDAEQNLAHIPDGVTPAEALICADVMATGFTAAEEAGIEAGQTVVVLGLGAIGLMAAAFAKQMGAETVIAVGSEKRPECVKLAAEFGADLVLSYRDGSCLYERPGKDFRNLLLEREHFRDERHPAANSTKSPAADRILDLTENRGADRVIICGGGEEALMQACDLVKYGTGIVSNVAYFEGGGTIGLPIFSLGRGMAGKTFRFSFCKGGRHRLEQMLRLTAEKQIVSPDRLITHVLSGSKCIPEALLQMRDKPDGTIKIMVDLGENWENEEEKA